MLREATYPPAAVNVLDVSSESMAAFQVFTYGRFWAFTEAKDVIEMKIPDGDHKKRRYQVVAMKPIDHSDTTEIGGNRMKYDKGQTVTNDKPLAQKVPQTKPY